MHRIKSIVIAATLVLATLAMLGFLLIKKPVVWTMVNVNDRAFQGDAHLIETPYPFAQTLLIDTGTASEANGYLVPFLDQRDIKSIDRVIITHPHRDHYGGLLELLKAGIELKHVVFHIPPRPICDAEIPWGCNWDRIQKTVRTLEESGAVLEEVTKNDIFNLGLFTRLKIIFAHDGVSEPVGRTDINDLSIIAKLERHSLSVLFAGDLNRKLGRYLSSHHSELDSTLLKVPHHAAASLAPNEFFDAVDPEMVFVPTPEGTWCHERAQRFRAWVNSTNTPVWVNGRSGHITTRIYPFSYEVTPEIQNVSSSCEPIRSVRPVGDVSTNIRMAGHIDRIECREDKLHVFGWVPWKGLHDEQSLTIIYPQALGNARITHVKRNDVRRAFEDPDLKFSGFDIEYKPNVECTDHLAVCLIAEDQELNERFFVSNRDTVPGECEGVLSTNAARSG